MTFVPLPPLIFLMIDEIVVRVFVTTLVLGVVLVVVLTVMGRREVRQRWHYARKAALYAAGCGIVSCGREAALRPEPAGPHR